MRHNLSDLLANSFSIDLDIKRLVFTLSKSILRSIPPVSSIKMAVSSDPKLDKFDVLQTSYKTVMDHGLRCDVLVPKARHEGKRPVIVNFHGGGLV